MYFQQLLQLFIFLYISGSMEGHSQKSVSSVDIRHGEELVSPTGASSRRRRFFSSFRKKFRPSKYKDKNANIEPFVASQSHPNIYKSVQYQSSNLSTDEENQSGYTTRDSSFRFGCLLTIVKRV